ncbi:hypothetical protein Y032_0227g2805 [Ancylostoma ceylanicum]|uniref:Uncharacterized protein n=1 Tax=Ancylostoma ceylanicum TaxID=53326 RepID=A0A016SHH2_9BILA|nr:hypothetical protein Y032_0227g2805 [Ancylostoma ceylanicum]
MSPLSSLVLQLVLLVLPVIVLSESCELFWSSRQSLGYEQGIQILMLSDAVIASFDQGLPNNCGRLR